MLTRVKFLNIGRRFQYKNTIFEKISNGQAKVVYVSALFNKDEIIKLPPQTWVSIQQRTELKPLQLKLNLWKQ